MTLRLQYPDNLIRRKPFIHRGGAMLLSCNHKRFSAADAPVAQAVQSRCTAAASSRIDRVGAKTKQSNETQVTREKLTWFRRFS